MTFHRSNHLPFPEHFQLTPVSENDPNLFKQAWGGIESRIFFGDKLYHDSDCFKQAGQIQNTFMLTPVKAIKGQDEALKQRDKAANDLFSTAVSKVRQPIEVLFNWRIEKTDIQRASKVRSTISTCLWPVGRCFYSSNF